MADDKPSLDAQFEELQARLEELVTVLTEAGETYWQRQVQRALNGVRDRRLAGVTHALGCYGGEGTLSDLVLLTDQASSHRARHVLLNRRLDHLRDSIFRLADAIASRTALN